MCIGAPSIAPLLVASCRRAAFLVHIPSALDPRDRWPPDRPDGGTIECGGDGCGNGRLDDSHVRDGFDAGRHAMLPERETRPAGLRKILPVRDPVPREVLSRGSCSVCRHAGPYFCRRRDDVMGRQSAGSVARPPTA